MPQTDRQTDTYLGIVALTVETGGSLPHTAIHPLTRTRPLGERGGDPEAV